MAMREVTGAVIATSLVLIAVFVPVSLFPGTTGILLPAVCADHRVLRFAFRRSTRSRFRPRWRLCCWGASMAGTGVFFGAINRGITARDRGIRAGRHLLVLHHWRWAGARDFRGRAGADRIWSISVCPTGFVPQEDQGYFIVAVQAPQGASLDYTTEM